MRGPVLDLHAPQVDSEGTLLWSASNVLPFNTGERRVMHTGGHGVNVSTLDGNVLE